ncbi:MAG: transposase [Methylobacteriaceae bacterium]|jgi:transposase|nr:transposase [Methylobacteriaceae bacterium]
MSLYSKPVAMPKKRITFKKSPNGTLYVYYTLRAYRNRNGKPTSDEVAIGKKDSATGMLIPNKRYFEIFPEQGAGGDVVPAHDLPHRISDFGPVDVLWRVAGETGLLAVLQRCFPGKWREMLACSFYMICEGNVMMYMADWFDVTDVPFVEPFDDRRCAEMFASLTYAERMAFFADWVGRRAEQEYIAYDVTSISTRAMDIEIAEWGYNRDHDDLPQVNLGMYYGATSSLPVYYTLYSGSITDKSHLIFMLRNAVSLGIGNVRFVLDRGFVSEDNLRHMKKQGFPFIVPLPSGRVDAANLVDTYGADIRKSANRIAEDEIYGKRIDCELYGVTMTAHVFFDPEKQALDEKELFSRIERLSAELTEMDKPRRITKKYTDYFMVEKEGKTDIRFQRDHGKIDERLKRAGYFIILSSDTHLSSDDVIRIYRERDVIEKNFDQLKNALDFKRLHTHINKTTEGKVFIGFLALIVRSWLLRKIKSNPETKKLTFEKVLLELRKIKAVTLADHTRVMMPLTKTQKTILAAIGIDHSIMTASLN